MDAITSAESVVTTLEQHAPWYEIVYCSKCGHIYGVLAKHVLSHRNDMPHVAADGDIVGTLS